MIVDACRRLSVFAPLQEYQYVGFGGIEFIDFELFHRSLGVGNMISIERDEANRERFEFNAPFDNLRMLFGEARDRLADIDWKHLSIVWLDYTDQLSTDILRDVEFVIRAAQPGSLLLVTVNAGVSTRTADRIPNLRRNLRDLVRPDISQKDVRSWGAAREQHRVLSERAASVSKEVHGANLHQIVDLQYADDSKMMTWGALILSPALANLTHLCRFEDFEFTRRGGEDSLRIEVPFLTPREALMIKRGLLDRSVSVTLPGVKHEEVVAFQAFHRYHHTG